MLTETGFETHINSDGLEIIWSCAFSLDYVMHSLAETSQRWAKQKISIFYALNVMITNLLYTFLFLV